MKVLAFVGDDPGQRGATCLLGVLYDQDGERHGEVTYCVVWDHALRKTDRREHVDPCHFAREVARHAVIATGDEPYVARVVIEVPRVGGRMYSADGVVTQGANYGIVLAASLCSSEFRAEVVEDADPAAGQWHAEAGVTVPKGGDRKAESIRAASALLAAWQAAGATVVVPPSKSGLTHDQADALLLAHLGVLRWLGRAAVPANAGATARAKDRAKAARDHEVARAIDGVNAKMLKAAVFTIACPKCPSQSGDRCSGTTCRERTWAVAATLKPVTLIRGAPMVSLPRGAVITCSRGVWRMGGEKVSRATLDTAIDDGAVRLTLDDKRRPVWVVR